MTAAQGTPPLPITLSVVPPTRATSVAAADPRPSRVSVRTAGELTAITQAVTPAATHAVMSAAITHAVMPTAAHVVTPTGSALDLDSVLLRGVTQNAALVRPGDLFVARAGDQAHGVEYAAEAVRAGAAAILTDSAGSARAVAAGDVPVLLVDDPAADLGRISAWMYGEPSSALRVLGVTGTSGKTSTAYLTEAGARSAGVSTGLLGTVETRIGTESLPSVRTTPEAPELQALLAVMVERGVNTAVMEVSSHALALGRVDGTAFAAGMFTNLSQDHLDFHGGMEDYFAAKSRLFDGRSAASVITVDDEWGRRLAAAQESPVTVSRLRAADWTAHEIRVDAAGTEFRATGPGGVDIAVRLSLIGDFNAGNALLALAALHAVGIDPHAAAVGMAAVAVPGRLERVEAGQDFTALVDYAHKPAAVASVLAVLRPLTAGRLIIVLGAGGDRDTGKRAQMGAAAARGADLVLITDDNPRTEDPAAIREAVLAGAGRAGRVRSIAGRADAIAFAVSQARAGDTVLVAGKGHETGQYVGDEVLPFDDRLVLAEAIAAARR